MNRSRPRLAVAHAWATSLVWRGWGWLGRTERALAALAVWLDSLPVRWVPPLTPLTPLTPAPCAETPCPPWVLRTLATRAHWWGELGRWPLAEAQLEVLVVLEAGRAAHWFNLGFVREQLGEAVAAQAAFERALVLAPRLDAAWLGLGTALAQQGHWQQAHAAWERHAQAQPLCPDALVCLVRLHARRADWEAVTPWLDKLRHFDPRNAMALEAWMSTLPASLPLQADTTQTPGALAHLPVRAEPALPSLGAAPTLPGAASLEVVADAPTVWGGCAA